MTLAAYQGYRRDCLGAGLQSGDDPISNSIAPRQIATESFNCGRTDAYVHDCNSNKLAAFSIFERALNKSHDYVGATCRDKFFARKIDAFSSQPRLPTGDFSQDPREQSYEYRSNSGDGAIVSLQEINDCPKNADHRSPWIPLGFLFVIAIAPILEWLTLRNFIMRAATIVAIWLRRR